MRVARSLPIVAVSSLCLLVGALAGCKLDGEMIEKSIVTEYEKKTGEKPKSAACPKPLTEKVNGTFKCTLTLADDTKLSVDVTMLGEGNVKWVLTPPAPSASASAAAE